MSKSAGLGCDYAAGGLKLYSSPGDGAFSQFRTAASIVRLRQKSSERLHGGSFNSLDPSSVKIGRACSQTGERKNQSIVGQWSGTWRIFPSACDRMPLPCRCLTGPAGTAAAGAGYNMWTLKKIGAPPPDLLYGFNRFGFNGPFFRRLEPNRRYCKKGGAKTNILKL